MSHSTTNPITLRELFFFSAFGIWLAFRILNTSLFAGYFPDSSTPLVLLGVFFLLFLSELAHHKFGWSTLIAIAIAAVALFITWKTGAVNQLEVVAFVYTARGMAFKRIAKFALTLTTTLLSIVILSSFVGIINDYVWEYVDRSPRHGLGFRMYSYLGHYFLNVVLLIVYLRKRLSILLALVLSGLNIWILVLTDSRNSGVLVFIVLVLSLLNSSPALSKIFTQPALRMLAVWPFIVFPIVSYWIAVNYDSGVAWQDSVNEALSGRLYYLHKSMDWYGLSLWGQRNESNLNSLTSDGVLQTQTAEFETFIIDNSFMLVLIMRGAVAFAVLIFMWIALGFKVVSQRDAKLGIILFIVALHSLLDPQLLSLHFNTFLLLFSTYGIFRARKSDIESGAATVVSEQRNPSFKGT